MITKYNSLPSDLINCSKVMILNYTSGILDINDLEDYDLTPYPSQIILKVNNQFTISGTLNFNSIIYLSNQGTRLGFTLLNNVIDSSKFQTIILKLQFTYDFENSVGIDFTYNYLAHELEGEPHLKILTNTKSSTKPVTIAAIQNFYKFENYFSSDVRRFLFDKSYFLVNNIVIGDQKFVLNIPDFNYSNGSEVKMWRDGNTFYLTIYGSGDLITYNLITGVQVSYIDTTTLGGTLLDYSPKCLVTENKVFVKDLSTGVITVTDYDNTTIKFLVTDDLTDKMHLLSYEVGTTFSIANCISEYLKDCLKSISFPRVISSVQMFRNGIFQITDDIGDHYLINNYRYVKISGFSKVEVLNNKIVIIRIGTTNHIIFLTEEDLPQMALDLGNINNFLTSKLRKSMIVRTPEDFFCFMGLIMVKEGNQIKLL